MATNIKDRVHPGKVILARDVMGTGTPVGDTTLASDTNYPVGSSYLDNATGVLYFKRQIGTESRWVAEDTVS